MKNDSLVGKITSVLNSLNPLSRKDAGSISKAGNTVIKELAHNELTWLDIENPTRKELAQALEKYDFDPLHVHASLTKGQLERIEREDKYIFILLRAPKYFKRESKIATIRLSFFIGKKYVITVRQGVHEAISALQGEIESNTEKRDEVFKKSGGYLTYQLLDTLTKDMTNLHEAVLKEVDDIEDLVFDVNTSGVYEIAKLRQKIVRLKRVLTPFKNITQELAADQSELTSSMMRHYKYLANDINKIRETLDEAAEAVEIYKDADFTISTERTNKILGLLTIIFTLGMPATIIGSFYGMNVLIPGGNEAGPWTFLGPYTTFYLVLGFAIGSAVLMLLVFKRKKWF